MTQPAKHTPIKDCPFCGTGATQHNWYPDECMCMNEDCVMFSRVAKHEVWNKRDPCIVKAVNSHAKLLAALKDCLREHGGYTIRGECEKNARAAIEEAEGG